MDSERPAARARQSDPAGAGELLDPVRADELLERVDLVGRADDLEHDRVRADVGHAHAEHVGEREQLRALRRRGGDRDQGELPLDRLAGLELAHPQDVDELVHLLLDLLERVLLAVDAQHDPRDVLALGRPDGEALDVVAAPREHARDAHQRTRLVLDEHRDGVDHGTGTAWCSPYSTRSSAAAPAGIIGKQCSARIDAAVDDRRAAAGERLRERGRELVLGVDAQADGAVRLGELHVVGRALVEADLREPLLEEHVLPLPDHAEVAVVDDHDDDRQVLGDRGRELLRGHLEAAVAVDADDGRVRARGLRADGGRNPVAHRAEAARGDEAARAVAEQVLHRPHLVLADPGRPDHVVAPGRQRLQRLEHALRLQQVALLAVAERELLAPGGELGEPGPGLGADTLCFQRLERLRELGEDLLQRPDDRDVRVPQLPDLGGVDVEVDDRRARRERGELAGDAVVEARADRHEHVALVHRPVRPLRPVHARPAEVQLVRLGERALRHQRRHDR